MKKQSLALIAGLALMTSACATLCEDECPARQPDFRTGPTTFEFDSAELTTTDKQNLDVIIERLKANPDSKVAIGGYADSTGNAAYNVDLSQRRAKAVKDYLVANGICAKRISTKGYGATDFIASNDTKEGRAQNRRAELVID